MTYNEAKHLPVREFQTLYYLMYKKMSTPEGAKEAEAEQNLQAIEGLIGG